MTTVKLTLSAEKSIVDRAKRLAAENGTSVSSLFARLVSAMSQPTQEGNIPIGPLTQEATGLITLPRNLSERQILEDALTEKYRISP
jgi:hypothetical protein